jgi:hypothetical protein
MRVEAGDCVGGDLAVLAIEGAQSEIAPVQLSDRSTSSFMRVASIDRTAGSTFSWKRFEQ